MVASIAKAQGAEIYAAVLLTIAALLTAGAAAFAWLPRAPRPMAGGARGSEEPAGWGRHRIND